MRALFTSLFLTLAFVTLAGPAEAQRPSASRPSASRPSVSRPSVSRPSVSRPSVSSRPSISRPSIAPRPTTPSIGRPSVSRPSITRPTTSAPTVTRPSISSPGVGRPATTYSGPSSAGPRYIRTPNPTPSMPGPAAPTGTSLYGSRPSLTPPTPDAPTPTLERGSTPGMIDLTDTAVAPRTPFPRAYRPTTPSAPTSTGRTSARGLPSPTTGSALPPLAGYHGIRSGGPSNRSQLQDILHRYGTRPMLEADANRPRTLPTPGAGRTTAGGGTPSPYERGPLERLRGGTRFQPTRPAGTDGLPARGLDETPIRPLPGRGDGADGADGGRSGDGPTAGRNGARGGLPLTDGTGNTGDRDRPERDGLDGTNQGNRLARGGEDLDTGGGRDFERGANLPVGGSEETPPPTPPPGGGGGEETPPPAPPSNGGGHNWDDWNDDHGYFYGGFCYPWWSVGWSCWYYPTWWYFNYWRPFYWDNYYPIYGPAYGYGPTTVVIYEDVPTDVYYDGGAPVVVNEPVGEAVVREDAATPPAELSAAAERYLTLGDRSFREGRFGEAVQFYAKAVEFAPDQGVLYLVLSDGLFATGDYHYAAFAIRKAFELDPSLATAAVDKHDFYGDPQVFDRQLEVLERYLRDHVADDDARLVLATNYLFGGRPSEAASLLQDTFGERLREDPAARLVLQAALAPR